MKDQKTIARFVELQTQGSIYNRVATEFTVSKPTLIRWSRQHPFTLQNPQAIETQALAEHCFAGRQQRREQLGRDLRWVETELGKRDLVDIHSDESFEDVSDWQV